MSTNELPNEPSCQAQHPESKIDREPPHAETNKKQQDPQEHDPQEHDPQEHDPQEQSSTGAPEQPYPVKDSTRKLYEKIVRRLFRYSTQKRSIDPLEPVIVSPTQVVNDFFDRCEGGGNAHGSKSTMLIYRAALLWHLSQRANHPEYANALQVLNERSSALKNQQNERKTPQKRLKKISEMDLNILVNELTGRSQRSKWAHRTSYWLLAGLVTGLRPIEWGSARWADDSKEFLVVTNAKTKIAPPAFMRDKTSTPQEEKLPRETGPWSSVRVLKGAPIERQIPVTNDRDRFYIDTHMRMLREQMEQGVSLEFYYMQCRNALWKACQKLWQGRKMYSLYTMRSQFSANAKAAYGSEKTAELMGHSRADSPSAAHYGKANQAHGAFKRQPGWRQHEEYMVPAATHAQETPQPDADARSPS